MGKLLRRMTAALVVVVLAGCGVEGDEYLGKWEKSNNSKVTMEIEKNGENFLIKETAPSAFGGVPKTNTVPAVYKDGMLQVATPFGTMTVAHVKASDTLTMGGAGEYKRLK